jgi:hypothetical protein
MTKESWLWYLPKREFRRFSRRALVVVWTAMITLWASMGFRATRNDAVFFALLQTGLIVALAWFVFRMLRNRLAQPTLESRALMEYGTKFDALTEQQREELDKRQSRDALMGRVQKDEREAEVQLQAEGTAYRLLRPGLAIVVAAYWVGCLFGPFTPIRETLAKTAIIFTWLAVVILVLPTMVRMWTQPDEAGEPRVVAMEREA